jgi:catechol 2,3-dioxygenase-like lactoylglutathione lyase family enzyme
MNYKNIFSGFSVDDIQKAKKFYMEVLGLEVVDTGMGLEIHLPQGGAIFAYAKGTFHQPASFTILNFEVENINDVIDELIKKGVIFERYDALPALQDEKGVLRGKAAGMGPNIAWFKDPAGNILSILEN